MSASFETMFYVREKPWHGLGTKVKEAPASAGALVWAGLDWNVIQKDVYTENGILIPGYKVNSRSSDNTPPSALSPTATKSSRTRTPSGLPTICWVPA